MNDFLCLKSVNGRPVWIRRDSIICFYVSNGTTTIVMGGAQDNDAHVWVEGDVTDIITGVKE